MEQSNTPVISTTDTLGNLAAMHPAATAVFLRHQLDFCCRGRQKLDEACVALGIDPAVVAAEIAAQITGDVESPTRWNTRPAPELIEHIIARYHDKLRRDLPGLLEAARKIERVHSSKSTCPHGLADLLQQFHEEIGRHLAKEEAVLFPALKAGKRGQTVAMPIRMMMQEHEDHGDELGRIRKLTNDLVAPAEACGTWRGLYEGLKELETDLMQHIHLENNVLFPGGLSD